MAVGGEVEPKNEPGAAYPLEVEVLEASAPEHAPQALGAPRPVVPAQATSVEILYVEDNPSNLRLVERMLARRPQVRLLSALEGSLALELAAQHRPHLILLDLHLPDLPGEEVLARLTGDPATRSIPVVVVTADALPRQIERLLDAGASDYLTKPFDITRFLDVIDRILTEVLETGTRSS